MITLPFNFNKFRNTITQFELRLPSPPPAVHAISAIRCYKRSGQHLARECSTVSCFKCAGAHKTVMCKVPKNKLHCSTCNMSNHTTAGHRELPGRSAPRVETGEEVGVFTCYNTGTSFVDGAVSINNGGKIFLSIVNFLSIPERLRPPESPFRRNSMYRGWGGRQEVRTFEFAEC